jgi:hypothetical protein
MPVPVRIQHENPVKLTEQTIYANKIKTKKVALLRMQTVEILHRQMEQLSKDLKLEPVAV